MLILWNFEILIFRFIPKKGILSFGFGWLDRTPYVNFEPDWPRHYQAQVPFSFLYSPKPAFSKCRQISFPSKWPVCLPVIIILVTCKVYCYDIARDHRSRKYPLIGVDVNGKYLISSFDMDYYDRLSQREYIVIKKIDCIIH
jgi:hypothetical protein